MNNVIERLHPIHVEEKSPRERRYLLSPFHLNFWCGIYIGGFWVLTAVHMTRLESCSSLLSTALQIHTKISIPKLAQNLDSVLITALFSFGVETSHCLKLKMCVRPIASIITRFKSRIVKWFVNNLEFRLEWNSLDSSAENEVRNTCIQCVEAKD